MSQIIERPGIVQISGIEAVIFDMDGVLVDSERAKFENWKNITGIAIEEDFFKRECVGKSREDICKILIEKYDLPFSVEELAEKDKESARKIYSKPMPIKPAIEFLKGVYGKYKIALAASQQMEFIKIVLNSLDITEYFNNNIFSGHDSVARDKPAPDIYLLAARKLAVKPEHCAVIEDSETGVLSAKNAGMYCIAVPNEFTGHQDFSKADLVVNSLLEVNLERLKWT